MLTNLKKIMKKFLIIPAFLLMCLTTNAQDYNWTVGGSSNLSAIGADQEAGGMFNVSALYLSLIHI